MNEPILLPRPLESAHFGVSIFSAGISRSEHLPQLLAESAAHESALIVVRIDSEHLLHSHALESAGGRLCDVLLTLSRTVMPAPPVDSAAADDILIRRASAADAAALAALGREAFANFGGHWHRDPRIPTSLATGLYAKWAADLTGRVGLESHLFLAEASDGRTAGFLSMVQSDVGKWHVPLAAVAPKHQGRRLLERLLRYGLREIDQSSSASLDYETQVNNVSALRTVSRLDFTPISARLTFHLWTDTA